MSDNTCKKKRVKRSPFGSCSSSEEKKQRNDTYMVDEDDINYRFGGNKRTLGRSGSFNEENGLLNFERNVDVPTFNFSHTFESTL